MKLSDSGSAEGYAAITADLYDTHSNEYIEFADRSFGWLYIERVALWKMLRGRWNADRSDGHFVRQLGDDEPLYKPFSLPEEPHTVLDLGCGTGRVIKFMLDFGIASKDITGVDISGKLLDYTRRQYPEVTLHQSSIDEFTAPSESIDLATANMVMHYLSTPEFVATLRNTHQALKPHGLFAMIDPNPWRLPGIDDTRPVITDGLDGPFDERMLEHMTPWGMAAPYSSRTVGDIVAAMKGCGFHILHRSLPIVSVQGDIDNPERSKAYYDKGFDRMAILACKHQVDIEEYV